MLLGRVVEGAVAVESFGLGYHRELVAQAGLRTVPLTVDAGGARVGELAGSGAATALLTPAHQFPLGGALLPERRAEVIDWARARGGLLIEDDYDGEFRYDRQPVGALQGLDPDNVVYLGTASKSLAPGLRLAWLPPGFIFSGQQQVRDSTEMLMYTDGLSAFSVFLEPVGGQLMVEGRAQRGATNAYMGRVARNGQEYRVTVVGEIPIAAAERVAAGLGAHAGD
jgi:hypothetical protein